MKRYSLICFCVAAALMLLVPTSSAQEPDAAAILRQAMTYGSGLDSLSVKIDMIQEQTRNGEDVQQKLDGFLQMGGKSDMFIRVRQGVSGLEVTKGGDTVTIYMLPDKTYYEDPTPMSRQALLGRVPMQPLGMLSEWLSSFLHNSNELSSDLDGVTYVGTEDLESAGAIKACHHLRIESSDQDTDIWISRDEAPLLMQVQMDLIKAVKQSPQETGITMFRIRYAFTEWQPNIIHAKDRFAFKAPEGATLRPAAPQPAPDVLQGKAAPPLDLELMDGGRLELAKHKGKNIVILDFWATWCGPCKIGLPMLVEVAGEYKDKNVLLYTVNLREDPARIKAFLKQMKLDVPVALDKGRSSAPFMDANGSIPRTVIVGKDGIVHAAHAGLNPSTFKMEIRRELDAMLKAAS
jgi:thiol-disulfide isomerase/thioredoxin